MIETPSNATDLSILPRHRILQQARRPLEAGGPCKTVPCHGWPTRMAQAGKRTPYMETMFILDLALDHRSAAIPLKKVPWGRFEAVLKQMNLE